MMLNEKILDRIIRESINEAINEAVKPDAFDEHMFDGLDYIQPGEVKFIVRNLVGTINSRNTPFAPIHRLVKFLDPKRNHVGGKSTILGFMQSKVKNYNSLVEQLNKSYDAIIALAKTNYGGFQKLDEFNMYLGYIYRIVMELSPAITDTGISGPGSSITAINGGNDGKDIGLSRILGDAKFSLANLSNILGKLEALVEKGKDPMKYNPYR